MIEIPNFKAVIQSGVNHTRKLLDFVPINTETKKMFLETIEHSKKRRAKEFEQIDFYKVKMMIDCLSLLFPEKEKKSIINKKPKDARDQLNEIKEILDKMLENKVSTIKKWNSEYIKVFKEDLYKINEKTIGILNVVLAFENKKK